ncbi:class I SAM-dependent methyltransferase [Yimella sp. RIT 621]|nr:class I SAM-dependent methyltransferase [Yimella sp. RIT 621]
MCVARLAPIGYSEVAIIATQACEVCSATTSPRTLSAGDVLQQCTACGHLTRDLAAAPAAHRDQAYGGEPTLDKARLALTYREMVRSGVPDSVFEIGFGTGSMLRRFVDVGATVAGADPDQLGLRVDEVVRQHGDLYACPVEEIPHGSVAVDLVFGIHVLEHVIDPAKTLRIAHALLKPGGQVQFFTPAGDSAGLTAYGSAWWMLEDPTHVRFFTAASAEQALRAAGFIDIEVRRPLLDSLSTDIASVARRFARKSTPHGVLASKAVLGAAAATAPLVIAGRAVVPAMRPTLQLIARRPR